jgi:predicted secreted protein
MTAFEAVVVYVVTWWLVLFMVLPWGVQVADNPEKGHATSAPVKPRLWLKVGVTSAIAAVIWGVIFWIASTNLISFRGA